jgi:transcriptional regulator with XRE-family HTH domain
MDMIGRIRRLHRRKNKSEREIARITGLSRNTVSKWLHGEVDGPPKYRRDEQPSKLTPFHDGNSPTSTVIAPAHSTRHH